MPHHSSLVTICSWCTAGTVSERQASGWPQSRSDPIVEPLPERRLSLGGPVEPIFGRPVVLVEVGDDTRIPPEQLLRARRQREHGRVAEESHVVDLLFEERTGELLVYRQPRFAEAFGPAACHRVESNTTIDPAGHVAATERA